MFVLSYVFRRESNYSPQNHHNFIFNDIILFKSYSIPILQYNNIYGIYLLLLNSLKIFWPIDHIVLSLNQNN